MISVLLTAAGIVVLAAVWSSVLRALVPRQSPPLLARWTARWIALATIAFARRLAPGPRERAMTMAAPLSLFVLLLLWLAGHLIGCTLLAAGLDGLPVNVESLGRFFTLSTTGGTRITGLLCWLFTIVLIGVHVVYLIVVMNAYHRRELLSARLSAEAERPPDAERILAAYVQSRSRSRLDALFADWTGWLADIRCSHVNYPALVYLRPASELCWLQAAVIMLDAAALLEAIAPSWAMPYTQALLDTGIRCLEKLSADLGIQRSTTSVSLQGREQYGFAETTRVTEAAGLPAERGPQDAWRVFQARRTHYAPYSTAIASLLLHNMVDSLSDASAMSAHGDEH
jgi:hypothetical protein